MASRNLEIWKVGKLDGSPSPPQSPHEWKEGRTFQPIKIAGERMEGKSERWTADRPRHSNHLQNGPGGGR